MVLLAPVELPAMRDSLATGVEMELKAFRALRVTQVVPDFQDLLDLRDKTGPLGVPDRPV